MATLSLLASCQQMEEGEPSYVVLRDGPVILQDAQFGVYYGNMDFDDKGVFYVVLSDAKCYQDKMKQPYLDSEGDMLVLQLKSQLIDDSQDMHIPLGEYNIQTTRSGESDFVIDTENSYVKRLEGQITTKWDLISGSVIFARDSDGRYEITTDNLRIKKGSTVEEVQYTCYTQIKMVDYKDYAATMYSLDDDIVDMPFADVECQYYGDLYGRGTGNFIVQMASKGILEDTTGDVPGVLLSICAFSRLYVGDKAEPHLENGRYNVVAMTSANSLFLMNTLLPGVSVDGYVMGTYMGQQVKGEEAKMEFISSGYMDVQYEEGNGSYESRMCTIAYEFKTSTRTIKGTWRGKLPMINNSTDDQSEPLSTLTDNVDCDFSDTDKYRAARLSHVETLHRSNVDKELDYDIAEAWQVWLEPRGWTYDEMDIPYYEDRNGNGVIDEDEYFRLQAYAGDGDVMCFEFILPLGSEGEFAPEYDKVYEYVLQPSLEMSDPNYEVCVSKMGRPYDEIFDPNCKDLYGYSFITGYDRCNSRRGFTWGGDFRGSFYVHYKEGKHKMMDGHAPMVKGSVSVKRLKVDEYSFEWLFYDDTPGTPYYVKGSWTGKVVHENNYDEGDRFRPEDPDSDLR